DFAPSPLRVRNDPGGPQRDGSAKIERFLGCLLARVTKFSARQFLRAFTTPKATMGEGRNLVGVDIGASGIKVCQIKESRKGLGLVRLGFVSLGAQVIVDGQVMDAAAVSEALDRAFR